MFYIQKSLFESNVILNRFKTLKSIPILSSPFESNVILNRFKTWEDGRSWNLWFESNVILNRFKTCWHKEVYKLCLRVMLF